MYYFVPSYYQKTGKWRGNSWVWYANRSMREFDDIVSQIKMFRAAEKEVTLVVSCYIPDLRYYLHRQGLSGIRIYSLFDQIQGVFSYAPGLLMWEDLDWPEDMEWVYTQFLIMGYQDGVHMVNIEFGPESYLLWIDRFEQKEKVCRQIYDDRGFLSSEIIYRDGREVEQIFYNTYGRKTCTYDLVQGTVLVKGRDGLKKYEKMEDLVRECIERYFLEQKKKCGSSGVLVLSASTFHNRLFLEGSGDIVTILSCYSERNTEQTDIYQIKMAIQGEYKKTPALVLVDTKELKEKADLQAAENAYSIALSILKNAKTRNDYRNAVWGLERANELVPNYKDSVSLISKYKDKIYVKYNIFGCSNSWVEKYLDKKLENVIGKKTSSSSAEVQINCRVNDNYNISTFPSNIENLIEIREIVNNAGEKITKEFIFQKIKNLAIEKITFNYEIEVSGLVKQRYSNNLLEKNEVHSLQYTGDIPKEYKDKDKIEKPLGETKMRNKILEKSNLERELNQIIDAMDRL